MLPTESFVHEWHSIGTATAEQHGTHWYAFGTLPLGIDDGALRCGSGVARVGVRRFAATRRSPRLAGPIDQLGRWLLGHALPPHVAVGSECDVREDGVGLNRVHGRAVAVIRRARSHAKEARLGIDGTKHAIVADMHPGNIVADTAHVPTGNRGHQHGKVGFATRRWECRAHKVLFALGRCEAQNQHVLGQPTLFAAKARSNTQSIALLAQQCIA
jgi:hypothetical protein